MLLGMGWVGKRKKRKGGKIEGKRTVFLVEEQAIGSGRWAVVSTSILLTLTIYPLRGLRVAMALNAMGLERQGMDAIGPVGCQGGGVIWAGKRDHNIHTLITHVGRRTEMK